MRAALAIALLALGPAARAADAMAFVSACRTTAKDPNVDAGALFALVHGVGDPAILLYEVSPKRVAPLASLSPPSAEMKGEENFEVQGGMWSSARASDVVRYLRARPFRLVADWRSRLAAAGAALPACAIDYRVLRGYESRHPTPPR